MRNKDKLQEFLLQVIQLQSKKQLIAKKLDRIEANFLDVDDLGGVPIPQQVYDDGNMMFDTLTATNDRSMETLFS